MTVIAGQRLWQALAGAVTMIVVTTKLNSIEQGWYYTFVSVVAIYSVFETGLSTAVLQITAHKFLRLQWTSDGVTGEGEEDFGSFVTKSRRTSLITGIVFCAIVYPIGYYLFNDRAVTQGESFHWLWAWSVLVLLTALSLIVLPILSIAEGSGDISEAYMVRLFQGVLGSILCWIALLNGASLWATIMTSLSVIFVMIIWLRRYRENLWCLLKNQEYKNEFNWNKELWPLYWRVSLSWIGVYFWSQLATPIVFYYQGAVQAGQMGLSLTIAHMVGILAQSWIARGVPAMSQAVASANWKELQRIFGRNLRMAAVVFLIGAVTILILLTFASSTPYMERMLPIGPFAALFLFVLLYLLNGALATQLRSFKKEPLLGIFLVGGGVTLLGSLWAAQYSASAVVYTMLFVQVSVVFPLSYFSWKSFNLSCRLGGITP